MRRIALGAVVGVATWLGSGMMAMAQTPTITPTGPTCVRVGDVSCTFTATINLNTPSPCLVNINIYNGTELVCPGSNIYVPKQGTVVLFTKLYTNVSTWNLHSGDTLHFFVQLAVAGQWYGGTYPAGFDNWPASVTGGSRPSSKSFNKPLKLALDTVERDRRREA